MDYKCNNSISQPFYEVSENGKVEIDDELFIGSLENGGFRTVRRGDVILLVRIMGNIIQKIIPYDIKQYVRNSIDDSRVRNYMIRQRRFFTIDYLNYLEEINPDLIRDRKDLAFFCFKNGIIEVSRQGISKPIPFDQFGKLVWSHHIIDREFNLSHIFENEDPVFFRFLERITGNDDERLNGLMTLIGYALHNYNTSATSKVIVLNDENISEQPEGGSGKTLLAKALGRIRSLVLKDGKSFNPKKSFEWSDVDETSDLVLIDESSKGSVFEDLFSIISNGINVERKNRDKYFLPIEKSPKLMMTTNTVIPGNSGSFKRRQYNIDLYQYFNKNYTPEDEFGHIFFDEWDDVEWAKFDALMLLCVHFYLEYNVLETPEVFQGKKDAIRATGLTFYEWFEDSKEDFQNFIDTQSALERYLRETSQKSFEMSAKKFKSYIKSCCEIFGHTYSEVRTSNARGFRLELNTA